MIRVAFCDDDVSVLNELNILIDKYRVERNTDMEYVPFHSPLELLAEIEKGVRFDILFLDVIMPGENGISTAKEIRKYDENMKIIFLTSSAEYAVQSYMVNAYFYQMKPKTDELHKFAIKLMQIISPGAGERTVGGNMNAGMGVPAGGSAADEIQKYKALLDAGAITEEEYAAKKRQLLGI